MTTSGQSRTARRKQRHSKKKSIWKKVLWSILILMTAVFIGVVGLFGYYIATAPELDVEKLMDPFSSQVYDRDGEMFADLGEVKRTKVEFDDLPQILIDAVIATEDVRFFEHPGIDLRRIFGAVIANITRGFGAEGASTITQQVVENSFLTPDKKLKLKVQEQWLALKLEREFSKEQILEMYLNKIYYGSGAYGVAEASRIYFGKTDLHDLTLVEAAILAGLPQRPSAYDPYVNPELTKERLNTVLNLMVRHGKITEEQAEEARQVDITSLLAGKSQTSKPYEAFLQQVEREVEEKVEGANIYTDGLKIYTTLDQSAQQYVEFLLTDSDENPIEYPDDELQAGMVVLDTKSGEILAIGGSRNRENVDGYNYAIHGGRQPGSTVKPIIVYGPAIEYNKISTYHQINDDQPYDVAGTDHKIRNWDHQYRGWTSARLGLSRSLNVPTVKLLDEVGYANAQEFAEKLGIQFHNDQLRVTDAIGGTETNVTPLQLAGAFRPFGNEGIYNEPFAVTKVEFPDGRVIDLTPEPEPVMGDYTAYMVTDMLKSAVTPSPTGTGSTAKVPGLPMAGKTGTTNLPDQDGANNSWFSGYSTNFTIAVWTGYKEHNRTIPNTRISQLLFRHTMEELSKDIETPDFVKPDSVVEVDIEKGTNPPMLPSPYTPSENIVTELFVKGHEPTSVSERYDRVEPVSDLQAVYDVEENGIIVSWAYESSEEVSFDVSAQIDDGQMRDIASTEDQTITIHEVSEGSTYTIQVVAVRSDGSLKSEPQSVSVAIEIIEEDENDEEENEQNESENESDEQDEQQSLQPVSGLTATFDEAQQALNISWSYQGPPASFVLDVNGQSVTIEETVYTIENVTPGTTYTITVYPIGTHGNFQGVTGESRTIEHTIPEQTEDETVEADAVDEQENE